MKRKLVGIVIFRRSEVLDFCGPYEVFSVTRLDEARRREEPSPFQVLLVAETLAAVEAAGGMRVLPDCTLADCPQLDILLAPGGWGRGVKSRMRLIDWIAERGRQVETLTSVCTGALLLGKAGLLDGRRATTHWRSLAWLRESCPAVTVEEHLRVVEDGHILTSAGISAGIDLALRWWALLRRGRGPGHGATDGAIGIRRGSICGGFHFPARGQRPKTRAGHRWVRPYGQAGRPSCATNFPEGFWRGLARRFILWGLGEDGLLGEKGFGGRAMGPSAHSPNFLCSLSALGKTAYTRFASYFFAVRRTGGPGT